MTTMVLTWQRCHFVVDAADVDAAFNDDVDDANNDDVDDSGDGVNVAADDNGNDDVTGDGAADGDDDVAASS